MKGNIRFSKWHFKLHQDLKTVILCCLFEVKQLSELNKLFIQSLNLYLQVKKSASYDWVKVFLNLIQKVDQGFACYYGIVVRSD